MLERPIFGALGLRPVRSQHTDAEASVLTAWCKGRRSVAELGVAEGGSAVILRSAMDPGGRLYLIDPFFAGRMGVSWPSVTAHRAVGGVPGGSVTWVRETSHRAGRRWSEPLDFLFIDADHSYEAVCEDWDLWSPHVVTGGVVAMHDAWSRQGFEREGPVRLLQEIASGVRKSPFRVCDHADSLAVLTRD